VAFAVGRREPPAPQVDEAFADFIARSKAADREAPKAEAPAPPPVAPASAAPAPVAPAPRLTHEQLADLTRGELERGGLIPAIKVLREHTGQDLKSTKEAVEYLKRYGTLPADPRWSARRAVPVLPPDATAAPSRSLRAEVLGLLRAQRKIEAIRLVRQHTGWGLKESKDYVESLE